jgi:Polysaccharide pyruvyl transferase
MKPKPEPTLNPAITGPEIESRRALILGFFTTVADLECLEVVRGWLDEAHIACDIAPYADTIRSAMPGAVDARQVDPGAYRYLIVVSGPCWRQFFTDRKIRLDQFDHCLRIGVNLTMVDPPDQWNPFDVLLERDSIRMVRPDLAFLQSTKTVPVVGRCLIERQKEYGSRQRHALAERRINELIARRHFAVVDIDTRWIGDPSGKRSPASVHSLMGRVDFALTTRLHGIVYALKAGKPVIAIDPVAGGDKVSAQARAIGWPKIVLAEDATEEWLNEAADWCLSAAGQAAVHQAQKRIPPALKKIAEEFQSALRNEKAGSGLGRSSG